MIKKIWESIIFRMVIICLAGILIFYGLGTAIEALVGKHPVCPVCQI